MQKFENKLDRVAVVNVTCGAFEGDLRRLLLSEHVEGVRCRLSEYIISRSVDKGAVN